jgi:hypothetical protein
MMGRRAIERSRPRKGIDQARLAPAPSKWAGAAAAMLSGDTFDPAKTALRIWF